jgi:hypothetical protein
MSPQERRHRPFLNRRLVEEVAMAVQRLFLSVAAVLASFAAQAGGDGLSADADQVPWARFQGRIAYSATTPMLRGGSAAADGTGLRIQGLTLMGDVYLGTTPSPRAGLGGFRATSGLILGARTGLWGSPATAPATGPLGVDRRLFGATPPSLGYAVDPAGDPAAGTVPYIGIGYSSLATRSGWSFSADLGLVSLSPGNAVRLGRVFGGGQNLDDVVRDMRLTPVVQLGVSYSF